MFGSIHQLLPAMAGVMGIATVWADAGYLPHTGPVPLRFRVPPPPVVKQINDPFPPPFLPPYFPPPALISLPMPSMPSHPLDTAKASKEPPALVVPTNGPPLVFEARDIVPDPESTAPPETIVSPQMLLKYFRSSTRPGANVATNANSSEMPAPLGFNPPPIAVAAPILQPANKATYSTSP